MEEEERMRKEEAEREAEEERIQKEEEEKRKKTEPRTIIARSMTPELKEVYFHEFFERHNFSRLILDFGHSSS